MKIKGLPTNPQASKFGSQLVTETVLARGFISVWRNRRSTVKVALEKRGQHVWHLVPTILEA
jgi:hypothetical protein